MSARAWKRRRNKGQWVKITERPVGPFEPLTNMFLFGSFFTERIIKPMSRCDYARHRRLAVTARRFERRYRRFERHNPQTWVEPSEDAMSISFGEHDVAEGDVPALIDRIDGLLAEHTDMDVYDDASVRSFFPQPVWLDEAFVPPWSLPTADPIEDMRRIFLNDWTAREVARLTRPGPLFVIANVTS